MARNYRVFGIDKKKIDESKIELAKSTAELFMAEATIQGNVWTEHEWKRQSVSGLMNHSLDFRTYDINKFGGLKK